MAAHVVNASSTPSQLLRKLPGWTAKTSQWQLSDGSGSFSAEWSVLHYAVTILLGLMVYDQGTP
jgi:hypothetical protein